MAMLITGAPGVGKQRLALWLGQLALCERPALASPCQECRSCRMARSLQHPDLHWHFPLIRPRGIAAHRLEQALEDARVRALAERRSEPLRAGVRPPHGAIYLAAVRGLRRTAARRPAMGEEQVFVLGDSESLVPSESSPAAANAMLKLLEEPPGPCRFVLTASEPDRLLPTIRSRTVSLSLSPLPTALVTDFLCEHLGIDREQALRAARLSRGSIGRALGFLENQGRTGELESIRQEAFMLVGSALAGSAESGASGVRLERVYRLALGYGAGGGRTRDLLLSFVEEWLRDLAAVGAGAPDRVWNADALERLESMVERTAITVAQIMEALGDLHDARERLMENVNPQLVVYGLASSIARRAG